jgi:transcriptional regulator with XRE-family HTH domain
MAGTLERKVGKRLRELRRMRRTSLRQLAEQAGLSPTTIHQIEAGRTSPGLSTLQALATTLAVPVSAFFEDGAPPAPAVFTAKGERPSLVIPGGILERLASGLRNQRLRGLALTLEAGAGSGPVPIRHAGQELVVAVEGVCVYEVDGRKYRLGSGDSLLLDSSLPHRAHNTGRRAARLLLVLYAPEEEPSWLERHVTPEPPPSDNKAPDVGGGQRSRVRRTAAVGARIGRAPASLEPTTTKGMPSRRSAASEKSIEGAPLRRLTRSGSRKAAIGQAKRRR